MNTQDKSDELFGPMGPTDHEMLSETNGIKDREK